MSKYPPLLSRVHNDLLCVISSRHLLSYNFEAVHGFTFGVDAIKSILLMCAVVDKRLTVEEAVRLSRLEVDFQVTLNCRDYIPFVLFMCHVT